MAIIFQIPMSVLFFPAPPMLHVPTLMGRSYASVELDLLETELFVKVASSYFDNLMSYLCRYKIILRDNCSQTSAENAINSLSSMNIKSFPSYCKCQHFSKMKFDRNKYTGCQVSST